MVFDFAGVVFVSPIDLFLIRSPMTVIYPERRSTHDTLLTSPTPPKGIGAKGTVSPTLCRDWKLTSPTPKIPYNEPSGSKLLLCPA